MPTPSSHKAQACTFTDNFRHSPLRGSKDVDGESAPASDAFCTAKFEPAVGVSNDASPDLSSSYAGASRARFPTNSTTDKLCLESVVPATLDSVIPSTTVSHCQDFQHCKSSYLSLLDQNIVDFVRESHDQIQQLYLGENAQETFDALATLDTKEDETEEEMLNWRKGLKLAYLLVTKYTKRPEGTVCYILIAIAFAQWYTSQTRLVRGSTSDPAAASRQVLSSILERWPKSVRERHGKQLNTGLACGLKWGLLAKEVGFGIFFKGAWQLAKCENNMLNKLLEGLRKKPKKMAVLGLLQDQFKLLLTTGRTDSHRFFHGLVRKRLWSSVVVVGLKDLCKQVQERVPSRMLLVKDNGFVFSIDSLRTLSGREWLNDDIILACLHLSEKLPSVRVGFSIPIHGEKGPIPRPFERAMRQIAQWRREGGEHPLVYLFPLFQRKSHFSLLEINEGENSIFHYDSLSVGANALVKAACGRQFAHFEYYEKLGCQDGLRQNDGHSCGPLVISFGRSRMLGRPIISEYNGWELRAEAMQILQCGFRSGKLIVAPTNKRKATVLGQHNLGINSKKQKEGGEKEATE
ncbi:hypothetical protein CEP54_000272 [Fusarium duplospermum]|uniref:Ubiquitin-like protease family profile domain-containing protein n=1 Tax=Fusarium duplospermum TaxID=1325734 RepID=A0A428R8N9_9HYPO|nr:hypothetical protein CEP54_000272 [Fusarium duplospermum]